MKRLTAIALLIAGISLPACAQHGGSSHGGFSGHSASAFHSSPASHAGFHSSAPSGYRAAPRYTGGRPSGSYAMGANRYARPAYSGYSGSDRNGNHRSPYRSPYRNRYGAPLGLGWGGYSTGYAPWLGLGYTGYPDTDATDYGDSQAPPYYDGYDPQAGGPQGPEFQGLAPQAPDQDQARPYYDQPSPNPSKPIHPSPAPLSQLAVTLVFKDGRPSEQIHNYLLSRNTISIWDQHPRQIPIDQLDLAATEKANREAGVDFHLPIASGN